ncbi:protein kinase domain-containing protein [Sorangium sp. So ce385]|uniref:protein kinase domain-containing protein n=1 Tax=Sorangium sp. So ce385 TaxID=3133308 RepID=UPI003F5B5ADF
MRVGDVLEGRFTLDARAGSGGMGEVFRARDNATGQAVAVKVMLARHAGERARFEREVRVLSELSHPAIVQFVAHGETPDGEPYLAMEWLEGEDLRARLSRGMLGVDESVALAARVAAALATAHARGVVHRDLKPSNLFLPGGDVALVKVLDFGIAHLGDVTRLTRTGAILGTPGYMAPEQAGGAGALDARADVFALGCVLYECLTGTPAFAGERLMAVLAKICCEEPPRVGALRAGVPRALDALVARMLAKQPDRRPRDGASVAAELSALDGDPSGAHADPAGHSTLALAAGERRVVSVVMLGRESPLWLDATEPLGPNSTLEPEEEELRDTAASFGGRLDVLADGSAAVTLSGVFVATDLAARAARCALTLHAIRPSRPMAVATGRSEGAGMRPLGDVIDRAARLVARRGPGAQPVVLDDLTAGLLDARFEVAAGEAGYELLREHEVVTGSRTLLGKQTACVGRARELALLAGLLSECVDEPVARAVLVTAPAGVGKSRLCHEFLRAARTRGAPIEIWIGRGDALRGGQAFGALGQALRGACEIREDDPLEARRDKLRARVARRVALADRARVTWFLGELAGAPFPDDDSAPLRAARAKAELMSEQVRRAWEDFLLAECAAGPVLLALDDLHWADHATVRLVDAALRVAKDLPLLVLASARPEVHERFPRLWAERELQEIRLGALTPRASEQLVRQVLGDAVAAETVKRLVSRSRGHAFYLEELIRAVAEGRETLPETVAAMVQAWIERFEPEARRLLRAASIFGEVFWPGAVASLLGGGPDAGGAGVELAARIDQLVQQEALVRRPGSRFAGEPELSFRHALLAEGAYAMLTEDERVRGHRLAGQWLEERGESAPIVLAEHFQRGEEPARAAGLYRRAAEQAARLGDAETAIACARRGLACAPSDDLRLALLDTLWEAHVWSSNLVNPDAVRDAEQIMALATPGSGPWARGALLKLFGLMAMGQPEVFTATLNAVRAVEPLADAAAAIADTLHMGVVHLLLMRGQPVVAGLFLSWLEAIVEPVAERDPRARGLRDMTRALQAMYADEDPWCGLKWAEAALESLEQAGSQVDIARARTVVATGSWFLGAYARAEKTLREAPPCADEEVWIGIAHRSLLLGWILIEKGELDAGSLIAEAMIDAGRVRRVAFYEGMGRTLLADALFRRGDLEVAEREVLTALGALSSIPTWSTGLTRTLAAIRLAQGRVAEALADVEKALAAYEAHRIFFAKGAHALLIRAEALMAAGDQQRALAAIAEARVRLLANAAKIGHPELRRSFLEDIREHARTLELARAWLGEA